MYSILCSKFDQVVNEISNELKKYIKSDAKVLILPWAFPVELDKERFREEYFKKDEKRYNRYIKAMEQIGVKEAQIEVLSCYEENKIDIKLKIQKADIIFLPGGNPEMFYKKLVDEFGLYKTLKEYKGIIIGESAGAVLHFGKYFLTEENSYYKVFEYYNGIGILEGNFEIDVHTINSKEYIDKLKHIAKKDQKTIYAILDDGAILVNRQNNEIQILNDTIVIN